MRMASSITLAALAALFLAGGARATTFDFSYSFPTIDAADFPSGRTSASGVFSATDLMNGSFLVTDVYGQWNGETITGVSPLNTEGGNDNLIFPTSSSVLDLAGLTFSVVGPIRGDVGAGVVNVFSTSHQYTDEAGDTGLSPTFNLTVAPLVTFDFSYSFPTIDTAEFPSGTTSASGIITAANLMNGAFLVTDVSGQWNGEAITGVSPLDTEGGNDNLIFPTSASVLDLAGLTFSVAGPIQGDEDAGVVNVFSTSHEYTDESPETSLSPTFNLTEVSSVPEPSGWTLMIVGFGAVAVALRRKSTAGVAV